MTKQFKKLILVLTIGNLGLHHVYEGKWEKSLGLLLSFIACLFSLMANFFLMRYLTEGQRQLSMAELVLFDGSFFTYIFYLGFIINRILWIYELGNCIFRRA